MRSEFLGGVYGADRSEKTRISQIEICNQEEKSQKAKTKNSSHSSRRATTGSQIRAHVLKGHHLSEPLRRLPEQRIHPSLFEAEKILFENVQKCELERAQKRRFFTQILLISDTHQEPLPQP